MFRPDKDKLLDRSLKLLKKAVSEKQTRPGGRIIFEIGWQFH